MQDTLSNNERLTDIKAAESIECLCHGFAHPAEPWDEGVFECVTGGWANTILRLATASPQIQDKCDGVNDFLKETGPLSDNLAFLQPAFGEAAESLTKGKRDPRPALCNLALTLTGAGKSGGWRLSLDTPARFRIGRFLLPRASHFEVRETATVYADGCEVWRAGQAQRELETLPQLYLGAAPAVCFTSDVEACADLEAVSTELRQRLRNSQVETIRQAIELLRSGAPEYLEWISRVIAVVLLLESRDGLLESASFAQRPGMLRVSADVRPAAMAEMLVHEASHQYFYLLLRLGSPLQNGDDDRFYSPLKDRGRPLDKILLGYHAFANVWLLHRRLTEGGFCPDGFSRLELDRTRREVQQMGQTLAGHADFSPLGRAIYKPLAERIR